MKNPSKYFLVLFFISISLCSFAGYEFGNGGNVVVCSAKKEFSVELLDVFEERLRSNLSIQEFEKRYSDFSIWYDTLKNISPRRQELYQYYLSNFDLETQFTNNNLPFINDIGKTTQLPPNCQLKQLVIQTSKLHPTDSKAINGRYIINSSLWNKLSPLNKAAVKLHEIVYRERISQCKNFSEGPCLSNNLKRFTLSSEYIRLLVGNLITGEIIDFKEQDIKKLFVFSGLLRFEEFGLVFWDYPPHNITIKKLQSSPFKMDTGLSEIDLTKQNIEESKSFIVTDFFTPDFPSEYLTDVYVGFKNFKIKLPKQFMVIFEERKILILPLFSKTFSHVDISDFNNQNPAVFNKVKSIIFNTEKNQVEVFYQSKKLIVNL